MGSRKYSKILTIILVIIIIAIISLLGYLFFSNYQKNSSVKDANNYVDSLNKQIAELQAEEEKVIPNPVVETPEPVNETQNEANENTAVDTNTKTDTNTNNNTSNNSNSKNTKRTSTYKGFEVLGTIEIPKTNVKYPILAKLSAKSLDTAVVAIYPAEVHLNEPGNTVIAGHNYRNGTFFSNNKKLTVGDKIYVTDLGGSRVTYVIYNKYETDENDTKSYNKDTNGKREITLSTCTDDAKARIIIEAREQ